MPPVAPKRTWSGFDMKCKRRLVWAASVAVLAAGWRPGTYGALTFGWLLIPIMIQLGFGAPSPCRLETVTAPPWFWTMP